MFPAFNTGWSARVVQPVRSADGRRAAGAARPARRGRLRAAHRVRERGEPAARARDGASREIAVRAALGAGRGRLVRQLLAERSARCRAEALQVCCSRGGRRCVCGRVVAKQLPIPRLEASASTRGAAVHARRDARQRRSLFGLFPALDGGAATLTDALRKAGAEARRLAALVRETRSSSSRWRSRWCSSSAPACCIRSFSALLERRPGIRSVAHDDDAGLDSPIAIRNAPQIRGFYDSSSRRSTPSPVCKPRADRAFCR